MQAGTETIAATLSCGLGILSTAEGQKVQEKAYQDILESYGDVQAAWNCAFDDERAQYVVCLYKEMLRQYVIVPYGVQRKPIKDIPFHGVVIPKGVTIFMNAEHANHGIWPSSIIETCVQRLIQSRH